MQSSDHDKGKLAPNPVKVVTVTSPVGKKRSSAKGVTKRLANRPPDTVLVANVTAAAKVRSKPFTNLVVQVSESSPMVIITQIKDGISAGVLVSASDFFDVPRGQMVNILGMTPSTATRRIKARQRLDPAASERLVRIAKVEAEAEDVFGSVDAAKRWMTRQNLALGCSPLEMLETDVGAGEVRKVLSAIAYGAAA